MVKQQETWGQAWERRVNKLGPAGSGINMLELGGTLLAAYWFVNQYEKGRKAAEKREARKARNK